MNSKSIKEQRIRKITNVYYSKPEIQKAIFSFSLNREVVPRYFDNFGKRPDSFQYKSDIFELVKKGATSFHCSEELWKDPLSLSTNMNEKQLADLRIGWDLLIDIDSKYFDYSKIAAQLLIELLKFHGIKNFGVKFSGSKGFHIIVPWKAFPKKVGEIKTSDMFPQWPRIIIEYLNEQIRDKLIKKISVLEIQSKYIKDFTISKKVVPDLILVSSRHLFRMPYSLHEKTALASVVLSPEEISDFQPKDANPLNVKVRSFLPDTRENEAKELLIQVLDWKGKHEKNFDVSRFKPIKIVNLSDKNFPPSIKRILQGMEDGRKRALFILINFFRSIGLEKNELEKRISEWNKKNKVPLKEGYIKSQLSWTYRNKIIPPPNYDKDYYKGIGIIPTEEEMKYKNPVNFILKKFRNLNLNKKKTKNKDNFKN